MNSLLETAPEKTREQTTLKFGGYKEQTANLANANLSLSLSCIAKGINVSNKMVFWKRLAGPFLREMMKSILCDQVWTLKDAAEQGYSAYFRSDWLLGSSQESAV